MEPLPSGRPYELGRMSAHLYIPNSLHENTGTKRLYEIEIVACRERLGAVLVTSKGGKRDCWNFAPPPLQGGSVLVE